LRAALVRHEADMIAAAKEDMGRADVETYFMEIAMNLEELDFASKHLAQWTRTETVKTPTLFFMADSEIHAEPYGVTLIVSAWNYPFLQLFSPLVGALAAGNTAILKPASDSPHSAALARKIIEETFPPEHVVVLEGTSETTTRLLEEKLDYIFFTGSPRVGRIVQAAAAQHLTPVTLELGGKSPAIVDDSADIEQAAKRIMWCKLFNAGQICVTVDHCYVHTRVKDAFVDARLARQERLARRAARRSCASRARRSSSAVSARSGGTSVGLPASSTATKVMKASTHARRFAVTRSSTCTVTVTSTEVRKAAFTRALRITTSPMRIGATKLTSSIEAVTETRPEWRCAQIAPAMSIHARTVPPKALPSTFECCGSTSSVISVRDARHERGVSDIAGSYHGHAGCAELSGQAERRASSTARTRSTSGGSSIGRFAWRAVAPSSSPWW
jgi:hypothetical protein